MIFINENKYKNNTGIYMIKNLISNKCYIGQTTDRFVERFWNHQWKLINQTHDNIHLQRAWNKYGEANFEFKVLNVCNNDDKINKLEVFYINLFSENSYNISAGGQGKSSPMSSHAKKIIGEKNRIHMLGRKHTEETKLKMSLSRKGKCQHKKSDVINEEIAFNIKTDLINKIPYDIIYKKYNINYRVINNMISNNTWRMVIVEGWDEFRMNRPIKLTKQVADDIRKKYMEGMFKEELMGEYKRSERTIRDILKCNIYTT